MDFHQLESLFISDPSIAIEECQKIICSVSNFDTFDDFYAHHLKNAHVSKCKKEWSSKQISIFCRECANQDEACICLKCFLNGNHEGHNILVQKASGNCDCGDPVFWKQSGFCSKHSGFDFNHENPENYVDEKLRNVLIDVIFKACFSSLRHFTVNNQENATCILEFVSSFLDFGDGFRRIITISLTEKYDFKDLFKNIINYGSEFNESLEQLFGYMISDELFLRNFSKISFDVLLNQIIPDTPNIMSNQDEDELPYQAWNSFWFYTFSEKVYRYVIEKLNFDWVNFGIKSAIYMYKVLDHIGDENYTFLPSLFVTIFTNLKNATAVQPNEQTQLFFDLLLEVMSNKNMVFFTCFNEFTQERHFNPIFNLVYLTYDIFYSFQNKPNLKFDKLFSLLDESIDLSPIWKNSNENDKLISPFFIQKIECEKYSEMNYKSFHNGATFFISFPLYDSLVQLFKVDWMSRNKIARFLSSEKYQSLRVKLGIITVKSFLSILCYSLSIVSANNKGLIHFYAQLSDAKEKSKYFTIFTPILQLIIGLQSTNYEFNLKEFFAFEIAHEIGLFDDFVTFEYIDENVGEKEKQMIFGFLYVCILLVIERKLFNYNDQDFIQEQIVFALKRGVHSIDILNDLYDADVIGLWSIIFTFNEILMKNAVTTKKNEGANNESNKHKKEKSFYLKDGVEWNPISAINSINAQMTLMNDEISKNPDKLLKIQNFESEDTYFFKTNSITESSTGYQSNTDNDMRIKLKQFLMTPTVLAIVYHALRMNVDSGSKSSDLNDHLALNILILISKFIKEDEMNSKCTFKLDESTKIHYDSIPDLIDKIKRVVFNYRVDESGNAFIDQTLNSQNFISFIKMKIGSKEHQEKSFVDLLIQKGKLGHDVLNEISLNVHFDFIDKQSNEQSNSKEIEEQKRQKAKNLKNDIMNHYKEMISNYNTSKYLHEKEADAIDDTEMINSNKEVCSICSSIKNNEISFYPIYIYRTKFPFVIDKPPLVSVNESGLPIDDNTQDFDKVEGEIELNEEENQYMQQHEEVENNEHQQLQNFGDEQNEEENDDDYDDKQSDEEDKHSSNNEGDDDELNKEEEEEEEEEEPPRLSHNTNENKQSEGENDDEPDDKQSDEEEEHNDDDDDDEPEEEIEELNERLTLIDQIINQTRDEINANREKQAKLKRFIKKRLEFQNKEDLELKNEKKNDQFKRCTIGANFILQFSLCKHLVHSSCVINKPFTCPIDRSIKNSLLPSIDSIPKAVILDRIGKAADDDSLASNAIHSISSFIENFASFFDCIELESLEIFIELVKSISALISTYEIRLRSLPDCLDSDKTMILSRNLFLTVWYGYRIQGKPKMTTESEHKLTLFQLFVKKLIETDEIDEIDFTDFVSDFIQKNKIENEHQKFIFMRRCCLSEHFLLKRNVSTSEIEGDLIDWDDVLSISNLSNHYRSKYTKSDNIELRPFTFMKFPKEFLRFSQDPFDFPVEKVSISYFFSIIDYNYLINHYDETNGEIIIDDIEKEKEKNKRNLFTCELNDFPTFIKLYLGSRHSPSVIISVGRFASEIYLIDGDYIASLDTFYLDKYGCSDIGYRRSQPLYFNEEVCERFVDLILSGDFAYALRHIIQ